MTKHQWIIASSLTGLALLLIGAFGFWQQSQELETARQEAAQLAARSTSLSNDLAQAQGQVTALQQEKEAAASAQKSMQDQMRAALQSKDVTISELQGKLTVNILDRILFNSGEANLKQEGEKVLRQIATVLSQFPHRQIHVIGHTDNIPIRFAAREKFPSNWELSTARATAAVRFLCEQAGVDPKRLGAVGYGEFYPVADNSTEEGRARNRRIEMVILPEEISKFIPIAPSDLSLPGNEKTNNAGMRTNRPSLKGQPPAESGSAATNPPTAQPPAPASTNQAAAKPGLEPGGAPTNTPATQP